MTESRTTDVPYVLEGLGSCILWIPLGSSISQHPWLYPQNNGDQGDWDQGFDLHTTPLNHKEEAGISTKGCLCAPIPQETQAKSSMKVSELQSKTVLPRVQEQLLHQSLCSFAEKHVMKNVSLYDVQYLQLFYLMQSLILSGVCDNNKFLWTIF